MKMNDIFLEHKNKIIATAVAVIVLAGVFVAESVTKKEPDSQPKPTATAKVTAVPSSSPLPSESALPNSPDPSFAPSAVPSASALPTASETAKPTAVKETEAPHEERAEDLPREQTFSVEKSPEKKNLCTLTVRCDEILKNTDKLNPEKKELIPENGIIFSGEVEIKDGESVFDVLLREMKARKIHMEFVNTPATNSAYIKGINNIYEFDCGGFSGWTYTLNGKMQNVGCSQCFPKPGDTIEWKYECELPEIG